MITNGLVQGSRVYLAFPQIVGPCVLFHQSCCCITFSVALAMSFGRLSRSLAFVSEDINHDKPHLFYEFPKEDDIC